MRFDATMPRGASIASDLALAIYHSLPFLIR